MSADKQDVKISKMVIQLSDDKISLSMEDAKKLHEALDALFGKKAVEVVHDHHYHDYWWYRPYRLYEPLPVYCNASSNAIRTFGAAEMFTTNEDTLICNVNLT